MRRPPPTLAPALALALALAPALALLAACSAVEVTQSEEGESCREQVICQGLVAVSCPGAPEEARDDCGARGERCAVGVGCLACSPGDLLCEGDVVMQCSNDGRSSTSVEVCAQSCARGQCVDPCVEAASASSYLGCEYWPTPILNAVNQRFSFAVAVANPNARAVTVEVSRGAERVSAVDVQPGALEVIKLPWLNPLSSGEVGPFGEFASTLAPNASYRLTSTLPVTAYQFNPLEYELSGDCLEEPQELSGDGRCNSYSNDASLLLPVHALGQQYMVLSYGAYSVNGATVPNSFQVVAVSPGTTDVTVTFSSPSRASLDRVVGAYGAGERATFTLSQGDVLQVLGELISGCPNRHESERGQTLCGGSPAFDLSGTIVLTSQPAQVFGSHPCAFVPHNTFACDHLEESLFPLRAWGRSAVVATTVPQQREPNLVRVFSSDDNNVVRFSPQVRADVTLARGQWVEFEAREPFRVTGTRGIQVVQLLVGQSYGGQEATLNGLGDPAMSLVPPEDQYRASYTFLTPDTFVSHYVSVVAKVGQAVTLNGAPVEGLAPIGDTGWATATAPLGAGVHSASSSEPFGVWVYGFGAYTSYMYPAGLDLRPINDVMY
ncbi:MAG: hypothetical protein FJ138_12465 [Deltaproteobacteria bacterium]|nr:hypothetical protein [Deltaproteobacteria bacterium]